MQGEETKTPALRKEEFECPVCFHLLIAPTTLSCGHTICLKCIESSFQRKRECPLCRQLCHQIPAINIFIQNMIERQFPKEYSQQKQELLKALRKQSDEQAILISSLIELPCIIEHNLLAPPKTEVEFRTLQQGYGEVFRIQQQLTHSNAFAVLVDSDSGYCITLDLNRIYSQNLYGTIFYHVNATVTGRAQLMRVEEYPNYKIAFKAGVFPIVDKESKQSISGVEQPELKANVERILKWFNQMQELIPRDAKYQVPAPIDHTFRNYAQLTTLQILSHINLEDLKGKFHTFFSDSSEQRIKEIDEIINSMDGAAPERILDFSNPYKGPGSFQRTNKVPKTCERLKYVLVLGTIGLLLASQFTIALY